MELTFRPLPEEYAILRLPPDSDIPVWVKRSTLTSITQAEAELSVVCQSDHVPTDIDADRGWKALRVDTLAELDEPGVVMSAITPISKAGFGVFVISTHLRDYVLVRTKHFEAIKSVLETAGHHVG